MEREKKVYIPKNIKNEIEFFYGFGVKELLIVIGIAVISVIPILFIYKYFNQIFAISLFFTIVATAVMLVIKDKNGTSLYKQLKLILKSLSVQKLYKYKK